MPIDYEDQGLLFDLELNRLLQNIADAGIDPSVILDCCSSGATRDLGPADPDSRPRTVRLRRAAPPNAEGRLQPLLSGTFDSAGTPGRYTVPVRLSRRRKKRRSVAVRASGAATA